MTTLSPTQTAILTAASQREDHVAIPLPANLRGGAAAKVVHSLLAKGFLKEAEANLRHNEPVWRMTGADHGVTLVATHAGLTAIGFTSDAPAQEASEAPTARPKRALRADTKQAALIAMLRAPEGATLAEIVDATGWQKHTARGAMSGALKKRLGLTVDADVEPDRGRVYRIRADAGS